MKLTPATFATVAPFFEAFEPLREGEGVSRFTDVAALMDMMVEGEAWRVWSATVISLETEGGRPACGLVMGPRFPGDQDPEMFELTGMPTEGYAVYGSILGWAGLIPEVERQAEFSPNGEMRSRGEAG